MHRKTGNKSSAVAEMGDNRVGLSRVGQPTSVPSDILIHAAVRPQQTCQKLGGVLPPFCRGDWVTIEHKAPWAEAYLLHSAVWPQ